MSSPIPPIIVPPKVIELPNKVRVFSDAKIQNAVAGVLANLTPDKHVAAVAHADGDGFSVSIAARTSDGKWTIMAGAYKPYSGSITAEAAVIWTPF